MFGEEFCGWQRLQHGVGQGGRGERDQNLRQEKEVGVAANVARPESGKGETRCLAQTGRGSEIGWGKPCGRMTIVERTKEDI